MASPSTEEYLEAILRLSCPCASQPQGEEGTVRPASAKACEQIASCDECRSVRPSDIAELVGVSRPSVTTALQRMAQDELIERDGKSVRLTSEGFRQAREVLHRHHVAERFLIGVLGFDPATVHDEACELEHALSERVVDALDAFTRQYLENEGRDR